MNRSLSLFYTVLVSSSTLWRSTYEQLALWFGHACLVAQFMLRILPCREPIIDGLNSTQQPQIDLFVMNLPFLTLSPWSMENQGVSRLSCTRQYSPRNFHGDKLYSISQGKYPVLIHQRKLKASSNTSSLKRSQLPIVDNSLTE